MPRKATKNGKTDKDASEKKVEVSRQRSQRNANKVVTYEEVDDKSEDEYESTSNKELSEDSDIDFDKADKKKKKKTPGPSTTGKKRGRKPKKVVLEEEDEEEEEDEPKVEEAPGKGKKRPKSEDETDEENGIEGPSKKKPAIEKNKMNKTDTDYSSIDFSSKKTNEDDKEWNIKISSWNVGGIKSWFKKNGLDFIKNENPDIFCLQETKCNEKKLPPEAKIEGYHSYWVSSEKEGYAGVGLYSKTKPIEVSYGIDDKEHDSEGRIITAEYEKFYLVAAYVPNAGRGLVTLPKRMKWDPDLRKYIKTLDSKKPVILCGDLNVAHESIDLANPKTNTKSAGFTVEERQGMTDLLKEGFVDTFRKLYPEQTGAYTFWTYMGNARSRNTGWRLDYFIISERLTPSLCDNIIRSQVYGSDHCPITLLLHIEDQKC